MSARLSAAAVLMAAAMPLAPTAAAQDHSAHLAMMEHTLLSISAEGRAVSAPDMGLISLGVQTEGATAAAALQANSRRMDALISALRRAGVAERDIQTSNLSVNPQYVYRENEPPLLNGYQANNTVNAKIRNLARMGDTVDAAIAADGNTLNGISFAHQNPDEQLDAARRDAIARARARAALYAEVAGLRVGRIVSISEGGAAMPPMPMMMARMERLSAADAAPPPPVVPGEVETVLSVSVVFTLE
jgi:uncharacterized protein YggE